MNKVGRMTNHGAFRWAMLGAALFGLSAAGLTCPPGANPVVPSGNRPPRLVITSVVTPNGNSVAIRGDNVTINFTGSDGEDAAVVRVFASLSANPTSDQEIPIEGGIPIGPGTGSGFVVWDTSGTAEKAYSIFAEIDDRTFNPLTGTGNPAVRVTFAQQVLVVPKGSQPLSQPPQIEILDPRPNLGLSSEDEVTIRYRYADGDSPVTVTLLLDTDLDPTNDDINNPGSNIIILPSSSRKATDPTFGGDPPPPDNPNNPPTNSDSMEIRTNPRTLPATTLGQFVTKDYLFTIDFSKIPVRSTPYFVRAVISDGTHSAQRYANGSVSITFLADGVVDCGKIGFTVAGCRFQGFNAFENLGSSLDTVPDIDLDGQDEMLIAGRYASPRNRVQAGAAYLVFGRRKTPFPPDTNGNGRPDITTPGGVVDFPVPPDFVTNPYDPTASGRFGGILNINSVGSFFRGTTYGMPFPHGFGGAPPDLTDPSHRADTAGLTSITRLDMTNDGIADLVFGLPFVSGAWDYQDNDPVDGGCETGAYVDPDRFPHHALCARDEGRGGTNDDINSPFDGLDPVDQGLVIMVSGSNDLRSRFRLFVDAAMAGQGDPDGAVDDEGVLHPTAGQPVGMRFRGGWLGDDVPFGPQLGPVVGTNQYGRTVAAIPSVDNDIGDDLLISNPGTGSAQGVFDFTGAIQLWYSIIDPGNSQEQGFVDPDRYVGETLSLPSYRPNNPTCIPPGAGSKCSRAFVPTPNNVSILGASPNDMLGFARGAGQFNQDGVEDILAGAPGADRNLHFHNGIFYVIFGSAGGIGNTIMPAPGDPFFPYPPRVEITGTHDNDQFGFVQSPISDMNGDGVADVGFASEFFDDDESWGFGSGADAGYVGVIFGARPLTGENGFEPKDVGTPALAGIKFVGATANAHAGRSIASGGDFNRDGYGDLLITSPGEVRCANADGTFGLPVAGNCQAGQEARLGVAYLIFGGQHLINKTFKLSSVGSAALPGIVFVSPYPRGTADEAPLDIVGGGGDVDGDGFDDVLIAATHADFVDPASPNQRRVDSGDVYLVYGNNAGANHVP